MGLLTARLCFARWDLDSQQLAHDLWGDEDVTRLIGGPWSPAQVEDLHAKQLEQQRDAGVQYWPIFLREGGTFVGCCGLRPRPDLEASYELGFHLLKPFWGRRLAAEAAASVISHAFGSFGACQLFAGHNPQNEPSRRTLLRLGFRFLREEHYAPTGWMHPMYTLPAAAVADAMPHSPASGSSVAPPSPPLPSSWVPTESRPHRPADLVEVGSHAPTIVLDIRYATANNFMGRVLYPSACALLQRPVAVALSKVQHALELAGLGLVLFDAYRPWSVGNPPDVGRDTVGAANVCRRPCGRVKAQSWLRR